MLVAKRERELPVSADGSFTFVWRDGSVVDPHVLFGSYGGLVRDYVLRANFTYKDVARAFERNRASSDWIRKYHIWRLLFERDYPNQFLLAHDATQKGTVMRADVRNTLDGMSQNPEREETYWKRMYERVKRVEKELRQVPKARRSFSPSPQRVFVKGELVFEPGGRLYLPKETKQADLTLCYIVWTVAEQRMVCVMCNECSEKPFWTMDMDYDETLLGRGFLYGQVVPSPLGLFGVYYGARDDDFLRLTVPNGANTQLVSACVACGEAAEMQCGDCGTRAYCSEACADYDWNDGHYAQCQ